MDNIRIKAIVPIATHRFNSNLLRTLTSVTSPGTEVEVENIVSGTIGIKSRYEAQINELNIIDLIVKAEQAGFAGVFVSAMFDCGVDAARELVNIPVIGGLGASIYTAMMLARKFSIIALSDSERPIFRNHIRMYGVEDNLSSIRSVEFTTPKITETGENSELIQKIYEESLKAITDEGAEAIVFGCTGFQDAAVPVEKLLKQTLGKRIPVMDPNCVAINYLELLIKNKLSHSHITYTPQGNEHLNHKDKMAVSK